MSDIRDVIIIGGGITGLASAYYLQESAKAAGCPVAYTLLESETRTGGKIITRREDGFTIEGGPDCFLSQKPWAAELCQKLGIGDRLMGTNDDRRKVFVINGGKLTPLPDGVLLIIPTKIRPFVTSSLISWPGKIRMGMDLVIPRRRDNGDETVGNFVRRRLGREALDKIAEPLMSGIHVSDPEQQSLLATFPRFRDLEVKHGSLIRGMLARRSARPPAQAQVTRPATTFITLRGGLGDLTEALDRALVGGQVVTEACVASIERKNGIYDVRTADGATFQGRSVILATPAYVSGGLVSSLLPVLGESLAGIRYVSTATVSMGFRRSDAHRFVNGFGFVIPRREQRHISACTWTSTKFDHRSPSDAVLLRSFVGGPGREHLVQLSDEEITALVSQDLERIMGLRGQPDVVRIFRWHKANPQYDVGHLDRVKHIYDLCATQPGLFLTGSAFDGIGVPDCVRQGQQTATKALSYVMQSRV